MAYTEQEAFDKVWDWFVVQGKPRSLNEDGGCAYRGKDGARCAVGVLVPDEEIGFLQEGPSIWSNSHGWGRLDSLKGLDKHGFLTPLQACHDEAGCGKGIESRLRKFAEKQGLSVPEESA